MLSVLRSSSDNHIAYDSKSSNDVLNSFETSRKNLALCGTEFIDVTLALPANECMKSAHALCNHARIVQIENYHQNDLVKGKHRYCMKFRILLYANAISENGYHTEFLLPEPAVSARVWTILNHKIEKRKLNSKPNYFVSWGHKLIFNINEILTLKNVANEMIRTKLDIEQEEELIEASLPFHEIPRNISKVTMADDALNAAITFMQYGQLKLKTIDKNGIKLADYLPLDQKDLYNFAHPDRQLMETDIALFTALLNDKVDGDKFLVLSADLFKTKDDLSKFCTDIEITEKSGIIHIILNISLRTSKVNIDDTSGHWVYCAIVSENKMLYGDPLGSPNIPTDLLDKVKDVYRSKYQKDIENMNIINISQRPNFPRQKCATICGVVCCLVALSACNKKVFLEIIQGKKNQCFEMIQSPTFYKEQIRLNMLKTVYSASPSIECFLPKLENIKFGFIGEESVADAITIKAGKAAKGKSKNGSKQFNRKTDTKLTGVKIPKIFAKNREKKLSEKSPKKTFHKENHQTTVPDATQPEDIQSDFDFDFDFNQDYPEMKKQKTARKEHSGEMDLTEVNESKPVKDADDKSFPNDDKYEWKRGKHVKKNQFQLYKCKAEKCTGTKKARTIATPGVKNNHLGQHWRKISRNDAYRDIVYLTPHSCSSTISEQKKEERFELKTAKTSTLFLDKQVDKKNIKSSKRRNISADANVTRTVDKNPVQHDESSYKTSNSTLSMDDKKEQQKPQMEFLVNKVEDADEAPNGTGNDATNGDDMFADLTDNGKDIIDLLDTDDEDHIIKKENPIYVYGCDMCSFETPDSNDLEKHIDIPHTFVCSVCDYQTTKEEFLNIHKEKHKDYTFFCELCVFQANNKVSLDLHVAEEHYCNICELTFPSSSALSRHVVISHENLSSYQCTKCEFVASRKSVLDMHVKAVHRDEATKYQCLKCNFYASTSSDLAEHDQIGHSEIQKDKSTKDEFLDSNAKKSNEVNENTYEEFQDDKEREGNTVGDVEEKQMEEYDCDNSVEDYECDNFSNTSSDSLPEIEARYIGNTVERKKLTKIVDNEERGKRKKAVDDIESEGNVASKKHKSNEEDDGTFVCFDIDKKLESFKLIQLEGHPLETKKPVFISGNFAFVLANQDISIKSRGHFDAYKWLNGSGTKKGNTKITSYKCANKNQGCQATKRKWICNGICTFKNSFCCTYGMPDKESSVVVYVGKHNHNCENEDVSSVEDLIKETDEKLVEPEAKKKHEKHEIIYEEIRPNERLQKEAGPEVTEEESVIVQAEAKADDELKSIISILSTKSPSSNIFQTRINDVADDRMVDTFHVIKMAESNKRPFDVCKDGFIYKRESSKKIFPPIFKTQNVVYYSCQGLLICVNPDCPIFKRISHLNNIPMKPKANKKCLHCPKVRSMKWCMMNAVARDGSLAARSHLL